MGVSVLGEDALNPVALLALPLVLVVGKVTGIYDRDEHLLRKTTLDEVPTLFWVATLYTLLIWLGGDLIVEGHFGRDQAVGVWALLASLLATRALGRRLAGRISERSGAWCWVTPRLRAGSRAGSSEAPGLNARVVGRVPLEPELVERERDSGARRRLGAAILLVERRVDRAIIAPRGAVSDELLNTIRRLKALGVRVSVLPRLFEVVGASVERDEVDGITLLGMRRYGLTRSSRAVKRGLDLGGCRSRCPRARAVPGDDRDRDQARLTRPRPLPTAPHGTRRGAVRDAQVPHDGGRGRGAEGRRSRRATRPRTACSRSRTIRGSPESEGSCGGPRSMSCPSCSTCCAATWLSSVPRPLVLDEDSRIEGWQRSRLQLPPGMTGPWQVFGSARIPLSEMVKIDYLYGANWSLWLDVKILLRTVSFVLDRRGL